MLIIIKLDDIAFELFPNLKKYQNNIQHNIETIKNELIEYYTYSAFRPKIDIKNNIVEIEIDTENIEKYYNEFQKAVKFCENRKFKEAKPILEKLIKSNPTNSEFYRVYGQLLETEGNWQEAINYLIDSLKWDPQNRNALIMIGNIYARYKDDIDTATKYYNKVLVIEPNDYIALNNLGGNLANLGKFDEAERYLQIAYEINDSYPNTSYGLALIYQKRREYLKAFDFAINCLKKVNVNDKLYLASYSLANEVSTSYANQIISSEIYNNYVNKLKKLCGTEIKIIEDNSISTVAKFEFAENHNRVEHILKYQSKPPAVTHLVMHELVHLDFASLARIMGNNMIFTTNADQKNIFLKDSIGSLEKLEKQGLGEDEIKKYADAIFNGLTGQIYNAPIDLFIEYKLYNEFPELRPVQFLSLHKLLGEYIDIATNKTIKETSPKFVRDANNIMNLTHAMQFFDLFGIETTKSFKTPEHLTKAKHLYRMYERKKDSKEAGEEYDILIQWANDLRLTKYFTLVHEADYRREKKDSVEDIINKVQEDPFNLEDRDEENKIGRLKFNAGSLEFMAVVMYSVGALKYFEGKLKEDIQKVAFEIAMLGTYGLTPSDPEQKYTLSSIPNQKFSALHLLAYEYVGFQLIDPSLDTTLDFQEEYKMANQIYKK